MSQEPDRDAPVPAVRRGARSAAREAALHLLFAADSSASHGFDAEALARQLEDYWRARSEGGGELEAALSVAEPEARAFAEEIVRGVASRLAEVDATLRKASHNWRLERMSRVDRTALRIGAWELLRDDTAPRAVILDQAVLLAKAYGSEESGAFVNGVLDRVAEDLGRK